MVSPAQSSESPTSSPNLSPSLSPSSSGTSKLVIDSLCAHIAHTTLTGDNIQHNHPPFMQNLDIANEVKLCPLAAHHSAPLPPSLSSTAVPDADDHDPMEMCESGSIGGLPLEEEECKTPRGEEHKIPELVECPPAPKRSRRQLLERPARVRMEDQEESVDSSDMEEALKQMGEE